ncbi:MAG: transglutaminase-like domain-containing protein [Acidobacteriia bacterium]|nr:transglutaminase-like domain-containing protein [Terriglobia bacterium]
MKRHPLIQVCWFAINCLLIVSLAAALYGIGWEFSTRSFLKGFTDAIIPASDNPEQKAEAILAWIANGPARRSTTNPADLSLRNPEDTLNFQQLLQVCGTATNAFVNLAESTGLRTRRLLLLNGNRASKHVVAEVLVGDRWIIVDPSYHTIFRKRDGQLVTQSDLRNLQTFREVTEGIPNYPQTYTYESTAHVRLRRIPVVGRYLRGIFNVIWPSWEESINWTLLVERDSFAMAVVSFVFFFFLLALRFLFSWYCSKRLGISRVRLRDRIVRVSQVLAGNP